VKVVSTWSGGKDSCFAYYMALKQGLEIVSLVTFMENATKSNFHGIRADLLEAQATSIGIPLAKYVTRPDTYERDFKDALLGFKAQGVEGLVTGDIYEVSNHEKRWLERVCSEVGLKPIRPLWQKDTTEIFRKYVDAGFKSTVVKTKLSLLGKEWLGRQLDGAFLADILRLGNVDPCGEGGEYHTVTTDGPSFKKGIKLIKTKKSLRGEFGQLDILQFKVIEKD